MEKFQEAQEGLSHAYSMMRPLSKDQVLVLASSENPAMRDAAIRRLSEMAEEKLVAKSFEGATREELTLALVTAKTDATKNAIFTLLNQNKS